MGIRPHLTPPGVCWTALCAAVLRERCCIFDAHAGPWARLRKPVWAHIRPALGCDCTAGMGRRQWPVPAKCGAAGKADKTARLWHRPEKGKRRASLFCMHDEDFGMPLRPKYHGANHDAGGQLV